MNRHQRRAAESRLLRSSSYSRQIDRIVERLSARDRDGLPLGHFRMPDVETMVIAPLNDSGIIERICLNDLARQCVRWAIEDAAAHHDDTPTVAMLDLALRKVGAVVERIDGRVLTAGMVTATMERGGAGWRLPDAKCPSCGVVCNGGTSLQGIALPTTGDLALCFECGALNQYAEAMGLVPFDESKLCPEDAAFIAKARDGMAKMRPHGQGTA